jgi:hypothetical protein
VKVVPVAFVLTTCATCAFAQPFERTPVADARPLMIAAIDSPAGVASGILIGDAAEAITRQFKGTSPIFIDVSTEYRYAQADCSRLKVMFWQQGILLPGTTSPRTQSIEMDINYCRDGLPPKSLARARQ